VIARCNSTGDLYPFFPSSSSTTAALATTTSSSSLWHRRLGHLGHAALSQLISSQAISCNKLATDHICHACQLGRHVRQPFSVSHSRAIRPFDLIHCDLWTSPVVSVSGYKYYLVILDDCTHYTWTFPLRLKSDTFGIISNFFSYVRTQFDSTIKAVQCDKTAASLTTPRPARSSSPMGSSFGCRAHTPLNRMDVLNALFAP
jgi:hypothetical protein